MCGTCRTIGQCATMINGDGSQCNVPGSQPAEPWKQHHIPTLPLNCCYAAVMRECSFLCLTAGSVCECV